MYSQPNSTPIRNRWGDALCLSAIKLGFNGNGINDAVANRNPNAAKIDVNSWTPNNVEMAAEGYLGACSEKGVLYCTPVKKNVEYYNTLFK